ncbi:hypothetical protein NC652_025628 [Populus alba x Populus x berolinensis]|nr:hypothetical protein NC652_025628 [Populus alba x Populus x berolinensis]
MLNFPRDREVHLLTLSLATLPRVNALAETERNVVMFVAVFGFVTASLFLMVYENLSLISDANWQVQKHRKYRQHILSNHKVPYNLSEHYEQFGVVLDDSGLETMLEKLMDDYLCPMSRESIWILSLAVFNVDDSEVTLNCLGEQFHGGDLFFHSVRCTKYVNTANQGKILIITTFRDEQFFVMVAIGHGARATISGHQVNLVIWCRSTFHFSFSTAEETSNDFSAGVEIVDPRKKKDNACQLLLRTGIAEEGWYIGFLSH